MHLRSLLKSGPPEGGTSSVKDSPETKPGSHQSKPTRKPFLTTIADEQKPIATAMVIAVTVIASTTPLPQEFVSRDLL